MPNHTKNLERKTMGTTRVCISGMHCKSCELLVEDGLTQISGVVSVKVDHHTGLAVIGHSSPISDKLVKQVIESAGYSLGENQTEPIWITKSTKVWGQVFLVTACLILLYLVLTRLGLSFPQFNRVGNQTTALTALLVGLTAGVSTCMALVGGLVAGTMGKYNSAHPEATWQTRLKPLLAFLIGRVVGFIFLGGLMGMLGAIFTISISTTAVLTVMVALYMLFLGVQLLGVFPRISQISVSLPVGLAKALHLQDRAKSQYSLVSTMFLGVLTFFVPCGFTQAMQLVALGSGSFVTGASVMGLFALGTVPGLLGIGSVVGLLKSKKSNLLFIFVGLILIFFAGFNLRGALTVLGFIKPDIQNVLARRGGDNKVEIIAGQQIIHMTQDFDGYHPNLLIIKRGLPVRWIITSVNPNSCASSLAVPSLNISQFLKKGENVIEFTPPATGDTINFSCSMGMYSGQIQIVDN